MNQDMDMSVHVKLLCIIIPNKVMYVNEYMCLYIFIRCVCASSTNTCNVYTLLNHCMSAAAL